MHHGGGEGRGWGSGREPRQLSQRALEEARESMRVAGLSQRRQQDVIGGGKEGKRIRGSSRGRTGLRWREGVRGEGRLLWMLSQGEVGQA